MEIGNEISGKIRSAIKAKLVELGSYVDDELPDYIMVMVANKKSKAQMTDDLNLFLGANTDIFTSWLHEVLNKLETATVGPSVTPTSDKPEQTTTDGSEKTTTDVNSEKSKLSESQTELQTDSKKESKTEPSADLLKESKKSKKSKRSKDRSSHHKSSKRRDKKVLSGKVESSKHQEAVAAVAATSADASVKVPESLAAQQVSPTTKPASQELTAEAVIALNPDKPAEAIISLNPDTHDFLDEEINQETKSQRKDENTQHKLLSSKSRSAPVSQDRTPSVVASSPATVTAIVSSPPAEQITNRNEEKSATETKVRTTSASALTQSTITVVAPRPDRKRKGPGSVVGQVIEDEDDKEDSLAIKRVASTVELQRRPSLPISKQANTSLLKKAVSAAQESTKDVVSHALSNTALVMVQTPPQATQKHIRCHRTTTASGAQKTLLVRAVNEATESISSKKIHDTLMKVQQPQERSITLHRTTSRTEIPRSGLVSRSRMREVAERDYDTQEFMKVEQSSAPVHIKTEEYYADDEEQEEEMDAVDSRHIFVEDASTVRARAHIARSSRDVQEMDYDRSSPDSDVAMVMESKPSADKHVVIKREKPVPPRPVSPKFIVTLDGPPRPQSSKKATTKAAALVAPRMDITRTIDNISATQPQVEAEFVPSSMSSYQDAHLPPVMPASEPELVYVPASQISPTSHQPMYSPTSFKIVSDFEQGVYARQTVEEQVALEPQQQQFDSSTNMVQPPSERCRFWPACKNGNDCPYVHPTAPCKTFPNCKFGDKCVFIHPNCKFDARCTKINCPFTHASKRSPSAPAPPSRPVPRILIGPPSRGQTKAVCKFFPKCNNMDCPFVHPRACRFGNDCTRNDCKFTHPQVATGAALKWSKEKHISERTFAVKSAGEQLQQS